MQGKLTALFVAKAGVGMYGDGDRLWLVVEESGRKWWLLKWTKDGKDEQFRIGPYPAIGLADARDRANKLRADIANDINPAEVRREAKKARKAAAIIAKAKAAPPYTYRVGMRDYLDIKAKDKWRSVRAAKAFVANQERYVVLVIGDMPMDEIGRAAVLAVFDPLYQHSPIMASRILGNCAAIFAFAKVRRELPGDNPFLWRGGLEEVYPKKPASEHFKAIDCRQLPELVVQLTEMGDHPAALATRFQIALALRPAEARSLRFDWIDEKAGTITLPMTKNGKAFVVPINEAAAAVIERCREVRSCEHLFAGRSGNQPLGERAIFELVNRLTNGASAHATARSCFADYCYDNLPQFSESTIEAALNHSIGDSTVRAYRRGDAFDQRRKLLAAWSDFILGRVALDTGTVIAFPAKAAGGQYGGA
jgi:integrase